MKIYYCIIQFNFYPAIHHFLYHSHSLAAFLIFSGTKNSLSDPHCDFFFLVTTFLQILTLYID